MKKKAGPSVMALLAGTAQAEMRLYQVYGEDTVLRRDRPCACGGRPRPAGP